MIRTTIAAAASALLIAAPAYASVDMAQSKLTGGSAVTTKKKPGELLFIAPPAQVGNDNFNDNNVRIFDEDQDYKLTKTLKLDVGGSIAKGTTIDSYYVNFDPLKSQTVSGIITFTTPILGIIFSRSLLDKSDYLGVGTTSYKNPLLRGFETATDGASFSGDVLKFHLSASSPGDSFRVLTAAVPEPATWAMMILGFGFIGAGLRSRRRSTTVAYA